jgi:hypothetical protein
MTANDAGKHWKQLYQDYLRQCLNGKDSLFLEPGEKKARFSERRIKRYDGGLMSTPKVHSGEILPEMKTGGIAACFHSKYL